MPDVSRSDSNRSDASRPRVSFNRDVHVKRINGPRTANAYSISPDGTGFVPTSVRRERPKTKRQMTKEAEVVLKQVDKISCKASSDLKHEDDKPKVKKKRKDSFLSSVRKNAEKFKKDSSDLDSASSQEYRVYKVNDKTKDFMSLDRKKLKKDKKNRNLEYLSLERDGEGRDKKKQLSPIVESPGTGADFFSSEGKEKKVDKMIKKLTEKPVSKLEVPTGPRGVKTPGEELRHNDNKPFSYLKGSLDKDDSKSASPTDDVIYAQVVVSGRDGNVQKTTVHARIPSNEVGRIVGDRDRSQVGLHYKIENNRDRVEREPEEMWKQKSDFANKKETFQRFSSSSSPQSAELYGENPGRRDLYRRKSIESDGKSPVHFYEGPRRPARIGVAPKYGPLRSKSPTDLRDLGIRRQILLTRSESLAKERYNSLKKLREPTRTKTAASPRPHVNGIKIGLENEYRYLGDDIRVNDAFSSSLRKIPKDVELIPPTRSKRETVSNENPLKRQQKQWKSNEKLHLFKSGNENNLLQKLTKLGKSKSFIQEKPPSRKIERVKSFFRKKREGKGSESEDDPLSSRYIEYRGSDLDLSDKSADSSPRRNNYLTENNYAERKRLPTPSSSRNSYDSTATLTRIKNDKNKDSHWLKSLDRLTKRGGKNKYRSDDSTSELTTGSKQTSLRFFGDTDQESTANEPEPEPEIIDLKYKYGLHRRNKISDSEDEPFPVPFRSESRMTDSTLKGSSTGKYKSKYDLDRPDYGLKQMNHTLNLDSKKDYFSSNLSDTSTLKNSNYDFNINGMRYGPSITRSMSSVTPDSSRYESKEKLRNLRSTPAITLTRPEESLSRRVQSHGNLYAPRRKMYDSSAESTTEGDSSQHSAKSMIYLHAATVGDIPGPRNIYKSERRSQSREELSSIGDGTILTPNKKTLSRSISVLAPWRPKHYKEDRNLHYDYGNGSEFGRGKPPAGPPKPKRSLSTERKSSELRFNTLGKENRRQKDLLR